MTLDLEAQVALIREWNAAVIAEAGESRTPEDEHCLREWSGTRHSPRTGQRSRLPPTQEIDQCLEDSPTVTFLVVPRRYEVQHGENDRYQERDEQDGPHRLLPLRLRRRVTSGLLSAPSVVYRRMAGGS
jgi:hypothetical protein